MVLVRGLQIVKEVMLNLLALVAFWGMLAVFALVVLIQKPDLWHSYLEEEATKLLGHPVSIQELTVELDGLLLNVALQDLAIGEQRLAGLDQLMFQLDMKASVQENMPVFHDVTLKGLSLRLQESREKGWAIEGFDRIKFESAEQVQPDIPVFDQLKGYFQQYRTFIRYQDKISLEESEFHLARADGRKLTLTPVDLLLSGTSAERRMEVSVGVDGKHVLSLDHLGVFTDKVGGSGYFLGHIEVDADPLSGVLSGLKLSEDYLLDAFSAKGSLDYQWSDGDKYQATSSIENAVVSLRDSDNAVHTFEKIDVAAYLLAQDGDYARPEIGIRNLSLVHNGHELPSLNLLIERSKQYCGENEVSEDFIPTFLKEYNLGLSPEPSACWRVAGSPVDLGQLTDSLSNFSLLSDSIKSKLDQLSPSGQVSGYELVVPELNLDGWRLGISLDSVSFNTLETIPEVRNFDAYLLLEKNGGYADVRTADSDIHLSRLFSNSWRVESLEGRVRWSLGQEKILVWGEYLEGELRSGEQVAAQFSTLLGKGYESQLFLNVSGQQLSHQLPARFLPDRIPGFSPVTIELLNDGLTAGQIDDVAFMLLTNLAGDSFLDIGFTGEFSDVRFAFLPEWPSVDSAIGNIEMNSSGIAVELNRAFYGPASVTSVRADIPLATPGFKSKNVPPLVVDLRLLGESKTIWPWLFDTPLSEILTADMQNWQLEGPISGELVTKVDLFGEQPIFYDLDLKLKEVDLNFPQQELYSSDITGNLSISSLEGLASKGLTGTYGDERLKGRIRTTVRDSGAWDMYFSFFGEFSPEGLYNKTQNPFFEYFEGESPFQLDLSLSTDPVRPLKVLLRSDLEGTESLLPFPLAKAAAEPMPLIIEWVQIEGNQKANIIFGDELNLHADLYENKIKRGVVKVGSAYIQSSESEVNPSEGLFVKGRLSHLELDKWQSVLASLETSDEKPSSDEGAYPEFQLGNETRLDVVVDQLLYKSSSLGAFSAVADGENERLWGKVENPYLKGNFSYERNLLEVGIDWLRVPNVLLADSDNTDEAGDPLSGINLARLPVTQVHIAEVSVGEQEYGEFSFHGRQMESGYIFEDVTWGVLGAGMLAEMEWHRDTSGDTSKVKGIFSFDDTQMALRVLGMPSDLDCKDGRVEFDLNWPGSPAKAGVDTISGKLGAVFDDGYLAVGNPNVSLLSTISVVNIDSLYRRMRLDFNDLFGDRIAFDSLYGEMDLEPGKLDFGDKGVRMKGPSVDFRLTGEIDYVEDDLDLRIGMTLPLGNTAAVALLFVNPIFAGAVFVTDKVVDGAVSQLASVTYSVKGSPKDPQVEFYKVLNDK